MSAATIANNQYKTSNIKQHIWESFIGVFKYRVYAQYEIYTQYNTNTYINSSLIYFLPDVLTAINKEEVTTFLDQYPSINILLPKILNLAVREFPQSQYELEVISDPESQNSNKTLFLYITTKLTPKRALNALKKLEAAIFKNKLDVSSSLFNFNLKFE